MGRFRIAQPERADRVSAASRAAGSRQIERFEIQNTTLSTEKKMMASKPIWEPPQGLDRLRPREVRLTPGGIALVMGLGVLLIGAVASFVILTNVSRKQAEEQRLLREEGADTGAVVTRLWRSSEKSNPAWVSYTFSANQNAVVYEGRSRIPLNYWRRLQPGSTIAIRFVPAHPEMNHPLAAANRPTPPWLPTLMSAGLVAMALVLTHPLRRQRFLLIEGRAAPGRVTSLKKTDKGSVVQYEYRILSGATKTGRSGPMRKPPGIGSSIVVIYDPEDPRRQALYPLPLVRLRMRS
jgi:Protein of unknown function (DUF3592)